MSSTDPFIPSSPAPVDPDDALADLEADFENLTAPPDVLVVPEDLPPIGRSWGFDFVQRGFQMGGSSNPIETNDLSTLIQWCEKAMRTMKGSPIHPPDYGMDDPEKLIGHVIDGAPIGGLESMIRDALTFHPRITDIESFAFDYDPGDEWVSVSFNVVVDEERLLALNATLTATTATTTEF